MRNCRDWMSGWNGDWMQFWEKCQLGEGTRNSDYTRTHAMEEIAAVHFHAANGWVKIAASNFEGHGLYSKTIETV